MYNTASVYLHLFWPAPLSPVSFALPTRLSPSASRFSSLSLFLSLFLLPFPHSSMAVPERGHQQGPRGSPRDRSRPHLEDQRKRCWLTASVDDASSFQTPHIKITLTVFVLYIKHIFHGEICMVRRGPLEDVWRRAERGITGSIAGVSCRLILPRSGM